MSVETIMSPVVTAGLITGAAVATGVGVTALTVSAPFFVLREINQAVIDQILKLDPGRFKEAQRAATSKVDAALEQQLGYPLSKLKRQKVEVWKACGEFIMHKHTELFKMINASPKVTHKLNIKQKIAKNANDDAIHDILMQIDVLGTLMEVHRPTYEIVKREGILKYRPVVDPAFVSKRLAELIYQADFIDMFKDMAQSYYKKQDSWDFLTGMTYCITKYQQNTRVKTINTAEQTLTLRYPRFFALCPAYEMFWHARMSTFKDGVVLKDDIDTVVWEKLTKIRSATPCPSIREVMKNAVFDNLKPDVAPTLYTLMAWYAMNFDRMLDKIPAATLLANPGYVSEDYMEARAPWYVYLHIFLNLLEVSPTIENDGLLTYYSNMHPCFPSTVSTEDAYKKHEALKKTLIKENENKNKDDTVIQLLYVLNAVITTTKGVTTPSFDAYVAYMASVRKRFEGKIQPPMGIAQEDVVYVDEVVRAFAEYGSITQRDEGLAKAFPKYVKALLGDSSFGKWKGDVKIHYECFKGTSAEAYVDGVKGKLGELLTSYMAFFNNTPSTEGITDITGIKEVNAMLLQTAQSATEDDLKQMMTPKIEDIVNQVNALPEDHLDFTEELQRVNATLDNILQELAAKKNHLDSETKRKNLVKELLKRIPDELKEDMELLYLAEDVNVDGFNARLKVLIGLQEEFQKIQEGIKDTNNEELIVILRELEDAANKGDTTKFNTVKEQLEALQNTQRTLEDLNEALKQITIDAQPFQEIPEVQLALQLLKQAITNNKPDTFNANLKDLKGLLNMLKENREALVKNLDAFMLEASASHFKKTLEEDVTHTRKLLDANNLKKAQQALEDAKHKLANLNIHREKDVEVMLNRLNKVETGTDDANILGMINELRQYLRGAPNDIEKGQVKLKEIVDLVDMKNGELKRGIKDRIEELTPADPKHVADYNKQLNDTNMTQKMLVQLEKDVKQTLDEARNALIKEVSQNATRLDTAVKEEEEAQQTAHKDITDALNDKWNTVIALKANINMNNMTSQKLSDIIKLNENLKQTLTKAAEIKQAIANTKANINTKIMNRIKTAQGKMSILKGVLPMLRLDDALMTTPNPMDDYKNLKKLEEGLAAKVKEAGGLVKVQMDSIEKEKDTLKGVVQTTSIDNGLNEIQEALSVMGKSSGDPLDLLTSKLKFVEDSLKDVRKDAQRVNELQNRMKGVNVGNVTINDVDALDEKIQVVNGLLIELANLKNIDDGLRQTLKADLDGKMETLDKLKKGKVWDDLKKAIKDVNQVSERYKAFVDAIKNANKDGSSITIHDQDLKKSLENLINGIEKANPGKNATQPGFIQNQINEKANKLILKEVLDLIIPKQDSNKPRNPKTSLPFITPSKTLAPQHTPIDVSFEKETVGGKTYETKDLIVMNKDEISTRFIKAMQYILGGSTKARDANTKANQEYDFQGDTLALVRQYVKGLLTLPDTFKYKAPEQPFRIPNALVGKLKIPNVLEKKQDKNTDIIVLYYNNDTIKSMYHLMMRLSKFVSFADDRKDPLNNETIEVLKEMIQSGNADDYNKVASVLEKLARMKSSTLNNNATVQNQIGKDTQDSVKRSELASYMDLVAVSPTDQNITMNQYDVFKTVIKTDANKLPSLSPSDNNKTAHGNDEGWSEFIKAFREEMGIILNKDALQEQKVFTLQKAKNMLEQLKSMQMTFGVKKAQEIASLRSKYAKP